MLIEAMRINSRKIGNTGIGFSNAIIERYSKFNEAYYGETQMDYLNPFSQKADEQITTTNIWNLLLQSVYFKLNNSLLTHQNNFYENMESQFAVMISKLTNAIDQKEYLHFISLFNEIKSAENKEELLKLYKDIKSEKEKKNKNDIQDIDINFVELEKFEKRKETLYALTEKYKNELINHSEIVFNNHNDILEQKNIVHKIISNNTIENNRDIYDLLRFEKIISPTEKHTDEKGNKSLAFFNNEKFVEFIENADENVVIKIINMLNPTNNVVYKNESFNQNSNENKSITIMRNFSERVLDKMAVITTQNYGITGDVDQLRRTTIGEIISGSGEEEAEKIYEYFVGENLILRQEETGESSEGKQKKTDYLAEAIRTADRETIEKISDRILDIYESRDETFFRKEEEIKRESKENKSITTMRSFSERVLEKMAVIITQNHGITGDVEQLRRTTIGEIIADSKEEEAENIYRYFVEEKLILRQEETGQSSEGKQKKTDYLAEVIRTADKETIERISDRILEIYERIDNFDEKKITSVSNSVEIKNELHNEKKQSNMVSNIVYRANNMLSIANIEDKTSKKYTDLSREILNTILTHTNEKETEEMYEYLVENDFIHKKDNEDKNEQIIKFICQTSNENIRKILEISSKEQLVRAEKKQVKDSTVNDAEVVTLHRSEKNNETQISIRNKLVNNSNYIINKHRLHSQNTTVPTMKGIVNGTFAPTYLTMLSEQETTDITQKKFGLINYFLTENDDNYQMESQLVFHYLYFDNAQEEITNKLTKLKETETKKNIGEVLVEAVDRMSYKKIEMLFEDMIIKVPKFKRMYESFSENSKDSFVQSEGENPSPFYNNLIMIKGSNTIFEYELSDAGELKYRTESGNENMEESIQKSVEKNIIKFVNMEQKVVEKDSFETKEIIDKQIKRINALTKKIDEQEEKINKLAVKATNSTMNYETIRRDVMSHMERELRLEKMRRGLD